jgi:hypothetical protein
MYKNEDEIAKLRNENANLKNHINALRREDVNMSQDQGVDSTQRQLFMIKVRVFLSILFGFIPLHTDE